MTTLYALENEFWQVGILPQTGASVAFGRVWRGFEWMDVLRPTPQADYGNSSNCASFVMIPWSNRIRAARFRFRGHDYQLEISNAQEGLAIHGDVRQRPWQVAHSDDQRLNLTFDSRDHDNVNFPFAFSARAQYWLEGADFVMGLSLRNEDSQPFPAGFGHHPYFVRPESAMGVLLEIPCDHYYEMTDAMPDGEAVPLVDRLDYRNLRPIDDSTLNDLFTGRQSAVSGRVIYPAWNTEITITSDPIYSHTIVYAPQGRPFFAVEPVTNANDGFNLYERNVPGTGVFVLEPGEEQSGLIRLQTRA
jgi:aldose 1-epimerase